MEIQKVTLVKVMPTKVWIESGMLGERVVVLQHEGCEPFDYAVFGYDYRYTSNAGTLNAAEALARNLGATEPIEHRHRELKLPTAKDLRKQMADIQSALELLEGNAPNAESNGAEHPTRTPGYRAGTELGEK